MARRTPSGGPSEGIRGICAQLHSAYSRAKRSRRRAIPDDDDGDETDGEDFQPRSQPPPPQQRRPPLSQEQAAPAAPSHAQPPAPRRRPQQQQSRRNGASAARAAASADSSDEEEADGQESSDDSSDEETAAQPAARPAAAQRGRRPSAAAAGPRVRQTHPTNLQDLINRGVINPGPGVIRVKWWKIELKPAANVTGTGGLTLPAGVGERGRVYTPSGLLKFLAAINSLEGFVKGNGWRACHYHGVPIDELRGPFPNVYRREYREGSDSEAASDDDEEEEEEEEDDDDEAAAAAAGRDGAEWRPELTEGERRRKRAAEEAAAQRKRPRANGGMEAPWRGERRSDDSVAVAASGARQVVGSLGGIFSGDLFGSLRDLHRAGVHRARGGGVEESALIDISGNEVRTRRSQAARPAVRREAVRREGRTAPCASLVPRSLPHAWNALARAQSLLPLVSIGASTHPTPSLRAPPTRPRSLVRRCARGGRARVGCAGAWGVLRASQ